MYQSVKMFFRMNGKNINDQAQDIESLLNMYAQNGQILHDWIITVENNEPVAYACTTDNDALNEKYNNNYIAEMQKDISVTYIVLCDDPLESDSCHCKEPSFFYLDGTEADSDDNPLICGDCNREIPLFRVPYINEENEHYTILNWKATYRRVESLWIESLSERFTRRQLIDTKSELNKRGSDICRKIEAATGKPCYLFVTNPIGGWWHFREEDKILEKCPECGGDFRDIKFEFSAQVCDSCRLMFPGKTLAHKDSQ